MTEPFTKTIYVKHEFTQEEMLALSAQMARAEAEISEKADELKSVSSTIKADIAIQEGILHKCAEKLRSGYEMRLKEATVKYESGIVKYLDKDTGEILEERPMSQEEQMQLSKGNFMDIETLTQQENEPEEQAEGENEE